MKTKIAALTVAVLLLPGCFAFTKKDAPKPAPVTAESPVVEAYLEYVGPPARWAGPETLTLHLTARDPEFAQLTVNPPLAEPGSLLAPLENRSFAGPQRPALDGVSSVNGNFARTSLARLATSVKDAADPAFSGCLYPLRLKLVRANGAVVERAACRSIEGWPVALNEVTGDVLVASTQFTPTKTGAPTRAVASH